MQLIFNIVVTILLIMFGVTWTKKNILNVFLKILCIILSVIGIILILTQYGYIIKKI
jgi:hypothetical protein